MRAAPRGYLNFLEVHRLTDELVVLWQLLAGGQLDENLAELTSTTTARGHSRCHSQALPTEGAVTLSAAPTGLPPIV